MSEKTNHHNNTIFHNNKLANVWKIRQYFHFILFLRRDWETILKQYNNKNTQPAASCFQQFSRVWNPDENRCTSFWKSRSSHQELLNTPQRWSARVPKGLFPTLMESSRLFLFWITFVALSNLSRHVQFVFWLSFGPTWKFLFWLTQSEVNSIDRKHYD